MTKGGGKSNLKDVNEYEKKRLMTIQANKDMMQSLGIKRVAASLTSLVESTKKKKRNKLRQASQEDDDFVLEHEYVADDDLSKEYGEPKMASSTMEKTKKAKEKQQKGNFIPPLSVGKFLKQNKKQQERIMEGGEISSISNVLEIVKKAIGSQQQVDNMEGAYENDDHQKVMKNQESSGHHTNAEIENENEEVNTTTDDVADITCEEDGELIDITNPLNAGGELILSCSNRKTRGTVYCRKLTALPPGEKINVEFDEDGRPVGPNATLYTFFLGQQVRNRSVCPVKFKGWEEYKLETLDHLWACIKEKCNFDDPEYRKEFVLRHAQRLFRDSRHKLKAKYFDATKLKTKEERIKNRPKDMHKTDWKYLVDYWSDPNFKEKSKKASTSRSFQKMPHYNGTKSYARLKEEIEKKNGKKCSRIDLLIESRTRKSKKRVDTETLSKNMNAVEEMKKLKEQREQGLNDKTDEQIFQDVLGKDTHGYLRAYGPGKSITQHFHIKPSRINLHDEVVEVKKTAMQAIQEARNDADNARKEVEDAKKEAEDARKEAEEARKDVEFAKNEAEITRKEVDKKIATNNQIWQNKINRMLKSFGLSLPNDGDSLSDDASS